MTAPAENKPAIPVHPYEKFVRRPFYKEINRETIALAPKVSRAVDIATGTGEMIQQMIEQDKLTPDFEVIGLDPDTGALETARNKFAFFGNHVRFEEAYAENLPVPNKWAQLVTFCNAAHLTDISKSIPEAGRISDDNGTLIINTAYERDAAYPDKNSLLTFEWIPGYARRELRKQGIEVGSPHLQSAYTIADYEQELTAAGFVDIEVHTKIVDMDQEDLEAICGYPEYVRNNLTGVELEKAIPALVSAVKPTLERRHIASASRGWVIIKARKVSQEELEERTKTA